MSSSSSQGSNVCFCRRRSHVKKTGVLKMDEEDNEEEWIRWCQVEDRNYRKLRLCKHAEWPRKVIDEWKGCILGVSRCAGPIALCGGFGWSIGLGIEICTPSGRLLSAEGSMQLGTGVNRVLTLGWDEHDALLVVQSNGRVTKFDIEGHILDTVSLEAQEEIFDAAITRKGQIVLRGVKGNLWSVFSRNGKLQSKAQSVPELFLPPKRVYQASSTIAAADLEDNQPEIFLSCAGSCFVVVSPGWLKPRILDLSESISHISLSPNGELLTGALGNGTILVIAKSGPKIVLQWKAPFDLLARRDRCKPDQLAWCGNDAISAVYGTTLVVFGPKGEHATWTVSSSTRLATESDGLRLLSIGSIDFVELVSKETERVFSVGSTHGSAILLNSVEVDQSDQPSDSPSMKAMQRHSAIELLMEDNTLVNSAETCLAAARHEWTIRKQQGLLRSASYGFAYADAFQEEAVYTQEPRKRSTAMRDSSLFPRTATTLRVLNSVRRGTPTVLITAAEFIELGAAALVDRVSAFGDDKLAFRVASFCEINPEEVTNRWAKRLIEKDRDGETAVASKCTEQFEKVAARFPHFNPPYVDASLTAIKKGRLSLAKILISKEQNSPRRVPILMELDLGLVALADAVASNDLDLVWDVLEHLRLNQTMRSISRSIKERMDPVGCSQAVASLSTLLRRSGDHSARLILYEETGHYAEAVMAELERILSDDSVGRRASSLRNLASSIRSKPGYKQHCEFEAGVIIDLANVALVGADLERKLSFPCGTIQDFSSSDLLRVAAISSQNSATRTGVLKWLKNQLQIEDQRFIFVCVDALAGEDEFSGIRDLLKITGNNPATGYMPFVRACLGRKNFEEAGAYARMIKNPHERARALAQCGLGKEAIELATKTRNSQFLDEIQTILIGAQKNLSSR